MSCLVVPPAEPAGAHAMTAGAVFTVPTALLAPVVTVPASANIGSAHPGQTATVKLGNVTVANSGTRNWVTTVSATNFTTGAGTPAQTITNEHLSYWSGPIVTKTGSGTWTPGQPTAADAQDLATARTACTYTGVSTTASVTWQPTITMSVPGSAVTGTYTGTLTHSAA
ncbi:hypothetical protein ACWD4J_42695 [Streptomyces sp. NPDC002577]